MTFNTRTTYTRKPVRLTIGLWGAADQCTMSQVPISIPWHREYWSIQLKAHLKPLSIKSSNTPVSVYIMNHIFSSNGIGNSYCRLAFYDKISLSIYHQIPDHHRWGMKKNQLVAANNQRNGHQWHLNKQSPGRSAPKVTHTEPLYAMSGSATPHHIRHDPPGQQLRTSRTSHHIILAPLLNSFAQHGQWHNFYIKNKVYGLLLVELVN